MLTKNYMERFHPILLMWLKTRKWLVAQYLTDNLSTVMDWFWCLAVVVIDSINKKQNYSEQQSSRSKLKVNPMDIL